MTIQEVIQIRVRLQNKLEKLQQHQQLLNRQLKVVKQMIVEYDNDVVIQNQLLIQSIVLNGTISSIHTDCTSLYDAMHLFHDHYFTPEMYQK